MSSHQDTARAVLDRYGATYAAAAGIRLKDQPAPLFQLLVLAQLLSARIGTDIAVATAGELFASGWTTPQRMRDAARSSLIQVLGRGGYRRYDERTATFRSRDVRTGVLSPARCVNGLMPLLLPDLPRDQVGIDIIGLALVSDADRRDDGNELVFIQ